MSVDAARALRLEATRAEATRTLCEERERARASERRVEATCAEATRTVIHSKADAAAVSGITSRNALFHHAEATRTAIHSKADASAGSNKGGRPA